MFGTSIDPQYHPAVEPRGRADTQAMVSAWDRARIRIGWSFRHAPASENGRRIWSARSVGWRYDCGSRGEHQRAGNSARSAAADFSAAAATQTLVYRAVAKNLTHL